MSTARRYEVVAIIVVLLNVADVLITRAVLRTHPASHEGNGLLARIVLTRWVWVPKVGLPLTVLLGARYQRITAARYTGLVAVAVFYALVLAWNAHILTLSTVNQ